MQLATEFEMRKGDRLQICLSAGYEINSVGESLRLIPILIRVKEINQRNESCSLICNYPKGIVIGLLRAGQEGASYWANTWGGEYSRLSVTRRKRNGLFILGNQNTNILYDDLMDSRHEPIVVEPYFGEDVTKTEFQLRVAAKKSWIIQREENVDIKTAADPLSIPDELRNLLNIVDAQPPIEFNKLNLLWLRLKNINELIDWYGKRTLSESTREELTIASAKVFDYMLQVEGMMETVQASESTNTGKYNKLIELIKQKLGEQETIALIKEVSKCESMSEKTVLSGKGTNLLDEFLDSFSDRPGFELFNASMIGDNLPDLPVHGCEECGSECSLQSKIVPSKEGSKTLWLVKCTGCHCQSDRADWGEKNQVISAWNKNNKSFYKRTIPKGLQLDGLDDVEIRRKLKEANKLIVELRTEINDLTPSLKRELEELGIFESFMRFSLWANYIKTSLTEEEKNRRLAAGIRIA